MIENRSTIYTCDICKKTFEGFHFPSQWRAIDINIKISPVQKKSTVQEAHVCGDCYHKEGMRTKVLKFFGFGKGGES